MLCEYGCGNEAIHQFKNGKWCCSLSSNSCNSFKNNPKRIKLIKKNHKGMSGKKHSIHSNLKNALGHIGKKFSEETKDKMRKNFKGNTGRKFTENHKEKLRKNRIGKTFEQIFGKEKSIKIKEKQKQWMLNGGSAYINSFNKSPSKPQVKLFDLVKEIYPETEINYPIKRINNRWYNLDVAIPELKICFESDGSWWHLDEEKDLERQKEIEDLGWKLIRYYPVDTIKQVPSKEQIKNDIIRILN
jgi:hypothetical protein